MKKLNSLLFAFVVVLLSARAAHAYTYLSPGPQTWDSSPWILVDDKGLVGVTDADGGATQVVNAINSLDAWNGAGAGKLVLALKGSQSTGFILGDGIPMLRFSDPLGGCTGTCLARTYNTYRQRPDGTYQTYDTDIVTNVSNPSQPWTSQAEDPGGAGCSGEYYVEGVMVHEVGHALGLGHTTVPGATMLPSVGSCDNSWAVTKSDDESGILSLYGSSPCTNCQRYRGDLTGTNDFEYEPNDNDYYVGLASTHDGWLVVPSGTDFDLELQYSTDGSNWAVVATSTSTSPTEHINYYGSVGYYRWRVYSYSGSGVYRFYYAVN